MLEAEGGIDDVVWVELALGCIAKEVADVGVLVLASELLEDDLALGE